ncbi:MAG: hypothetical protein CMB55_05860 [Euryarchaeota archaeon]|nr:hypothetical protein [Euryarchaeota archaeon]
MESRPWWPKGIALSHDENSITTSWGTVPLHLPNPTIEWWNEIDDAWGDWPIISKIELIEEDRTGMWYDLGNFRALIIPIPTGKHTSRLWRNPQLRVSLKHHLQLPVAGVDKDGDHILVYPKTKVEPVTAKTLAGLHNALISGKWFTPQDEYGWNNRLKKIEDTLKTSTLWRAPHSHNTIGIPRIELRGMMPVPIPLSEALLWKNDTNLPMLRQALKYGVLLDWMQLISARYRGEDVMRVATGGVAHIIYDLKLLEKAEATAFGLDSKELDRYLDNVDRFQAKLGVMRLMLMGTPLAIIGLIASYMLGRAGEFTNPSVGYWTFGIIWLISAIAYNFTEPDWRQEL